MSKQELSIKDTVAFAKAAYGGTANLLNISVYTHCYSVAKLAEQIAQKLFGDIRSDLLPPDVDEIIAAIVHASLLQDAISIGRKTFENIAEIANVQVAAMVATLSRDYRLVETKRDIEYRGRLSHSAVSTQIAAVAGIVCLAQEIVNALAKEDAHIALNLGKIKKMLAQLDGDLLVIHTAARYYTLRLYVHAARNLIAEANLLLKKIKASIRQAKQNEKIAANIAKRLEAEKIELQATTTKEGRHGKKRVVRQDC
jgi:hypothetical protein